MKSKLKKHLSVIFAFALLFVAIGSGAMLLSGNVETAQAASKIHLKKTSDYVAVSDTYNLKLINKNGKTISASKISWSTSKKSVATVSKKGVVTAKKAGTAKIYAKYNGKKYTFTAKVKKPYVDTEYAVLIPGATVSSSLRLTQSKALSLDKVDWEIGDTTIATIDGDGNLAALKVGTTTLEATYNGKTYTKDVTIVEPKLAEDSVTLQVGVERSVLLLAESPSGEVGEWAGSGLVTWESSNTSVATTENYYGLQTITGVSAGKATITGKYNGKTYALNVKVIPEVKLNYTKKSMEKGETLQLEINQSEKVKWTTSSSSVATVSDKGLVTAVGYGKATITAEVEGIQVTCSITIKEPTLYVAKDTVTLSKDGTYKLAVTFTRSGTIRYSVADTSVVSCSWMDGWEGQTAKLKINAENPGTTTVTITNTYDNTKVKVKVTVESPLKIILPSLPKTLNERDYKDRIEATFVITDVRYETKYYSYDDHYTVYLYFDGKKTYDEDGSGQSSSCDIGWKLYSSSGAVVESGTCYTSGLAMGERFEDEEAIIFDLKEGTYTLKLLDTN